MNGNALRTSALTMSFLNLVYVLPMGPTLPGTPGGSRISARFDLALPKSASELSQDFDYPVPNVSTWSHIPSSLSVRSALGSDPYNSSVQCVDAKTSYFVQAHIFRHGKSIGSTSQEIRMYTGLEPQPPTCLSDFSSEYLCSQKKTLRKNLLTQVGSVSCAVAEPHPFTFSQGAAFAITKLPISFLLHTPCTATTTPLNASITWRLRTSTFLSTVPMTSVPTVALAARKPSITHITTLGAMHNLKLVLNNFQPLSSNPTHPSSETSTLQHDLALTLPSAPQLAPSFATPHLARRYSLAICVKVTGHGRASVRLEVPVQIVYESGSEREREGRGRHCAAVHGAQDDHQHRHHRRQSWQVLAAEAETGAELPVYVP